jgi:RNA polymerase sigma-70 factor, ECF subfamily
VRLYVATGLFPNAFNIQISSSESYAGFLFTFDHGINYNCTMIRGLDSENLLSELKKGDKKAFTQIFQLYHSRLSHFARSYVIDPDVAVNLVQDAFLKLWENSNKLKDSTSIAAYLYTITRNNCLNYLKHQKVEAKYHQKITKNSLELDLNLGALKRLEYDLYDFEEVQQIIDRTIEMLSPQVKQVFLLSRYENLSNAEIAEKLGITVKAVEANITRALKVFRMELKDYLSLLVFFSLPHL